jgi:hypothetical protein
VATDVLRRARLLKGLIFAKLGRCPKCFRASAIGALIGWLTETVVRVAWPHSPASAVVLVWPLAFTTLWALHMLVFARRMVSFQKSEATAGRAAPATRRRALQMFTNGLLYAVAISVALPRAAQADPACPDGYYSCGNGWCCESSGGPCCGNGHCCPSGKVCCGGRGCCQSGWYLCLQSSCADIRGNSCYDLNSSSEDQVARIRDCCGMTLLSC